MDENDPNIWQTTQNCSFKFFSSSNCGTYSGFPNESLTVSINFCNKNIQNHLKSVNVKDDSIPSEGHLICFRSGIFKLMPGYTVCPYHRYTLGIRWRRPNSCSFPGHSGKSKPESDRSVNKKMSLFVMMKRGFLLPVGSGRCEMNYIAFITKSMDHLIPWVERGYLYIRLDLHQTWSFWTQFIVDIFVDITCQEHWIVYTSMIYKSLLFAQNSQPYNISCILYKSFKSSIFMKHFTKFSFD